MNTDQAKKSSRYCDRVIGRTFVVMLVLFVGMIPLTINAMPAIGLWEQVWIAFAVSAVGVLTGLAFLGIAAETARCIRSACDSCLKAIRGDARKNDDDAAGDIFPTAG